MSKHDNVSGPGNTEAEIVLLYTELASHPEKDFGWGKGRENARRLGYDAEWFDRLPESVWESACAVGNPFVLGPIRAGEAVLDLGCGSGADSCVAALLAGDQGRVVGIDITPAMIEKARRNAWLAALTNVDFHESDMARVPLPDASIDLIISNGAINLARDKAKVFREASRVLRPGGRLQFADVVRTEQGGCAAAPTKPTWANCVAGTLPAETVLSMLRSAGFDDAILTGLTDYRTSPTTTGATFRAVKPQARTRP